MRLRAYWAARRERRQDPGELRNRLRLSKPDLERAAYQHLDAAPHLRRHVTKAVGMHLADNVWASVDRHLFPDASGKIRPARQRTAWVYAWLAAMVF